jgi:hypothetical protein
MVFWKEDRFRSLAWSCLRWIMIKYTTIILPGAGNWSRNFKYRLQLGLWPKALAPCGSGSATLRGIYFGMKTIFIPPPLLKMIFFPPLATRRFWLHQGLFALVFPILHYFTLPFSNFLSPFFIFPFPLFLFLLHFPPFSLSPFFLFLLHFTPFHIFSPNNIG